MFIFCFIQGRFVLLGSYHFLAEWRVC